MTLADDFPAPPAGKPLWLITLADLALLLVGFFVLLQANQEVDRATFAKGIRAGFGAPAAALAPPPEPIALAAAAMTGFAPGSAALPQSPAALADWATDAVRDPRVRLKITGATDGSTADVDRATGSAAVLAADRARAVAGALAHVAPGRLVIVNATRPSRRQVVVTLAFDGETE